MMSTPKHTPISGRLDDRIALVTGAASGMGEATAAALGHAGATVLVHARSEQTATDAVVRLRKESPNGNYVPVHADLTTLAGVHELAAAVVTSAPGGINVLVNNAGAAFSTRELTADGVERTIAVNHLAVAALTDDLLESLLAAAATSGAPSRVINVSSLIHRRGKPVTDWTYPDGFKQISSYADSKLLSLMYGYALARRLDGTGITVNAANPGSVNTGFGTKSGGLLSFAQKMSTPLLTTPAKGATSSVTLATDPTLANATGGYYTKGKPKTSSRKSLDVSAAQEVYAETQAVLRAITRLGSSSEPG